jgi:N-methylhydantoinase A
VSDANLVLGRLGATGLLGGAVPLDAGRAEAAIDALARDLGLARIETARGIVRVVNASMANAVRLVTVQRGVDPTGLTLVPFGGAGPLHAGELARELGIRAIAVPPGPGLLCALGLLVEDLRTDAVRTHLAPLDTRALPALAAHFEALEREAVAWLDREGVADERRRLERWLDLRYVGQNFELLVPVPEETWVAGDCTALRRRFLEAHERVYGFATEDEPVQVVNVRLVARGLADPPALARLPRAADADASSARVARRDVHVGDREGVVACDVYDRARLLAGHRIEGPAVVEQFDATTWLLPGQEARVDDLGFLIVQEAARR